MQLDEPFQVAGGKKVGARGSALSLGVLSTQALEHPAGRRDAGRCPPRALPQAVCSEDEMDRLAESDETSCTLEDDLRLADRQDNASHRPPRRLVQSKDPPDTEPGPIGNAGQGPLGCLNRHHDKKKGWPCVIEILPEGTEEFKESKSVAHIQRDRQLPDAGQVTLCRSDYPRSDPGVGRSEKGFGAYLGQSDHSDRGKPLPDQVPYNLQSAPAGPQSPQWSTARTTSVISSYWCDIPKCVETPVGVVTGNGLVTSYILQSSISPTVKPSEGLHSREGGSLSFADLYSFFSLWTIRARSLRAAGVERNRRKRIGQLRIAFHGLAEYRDIRRAQQRRIANFELRRRRNDIHRNFQSLCSCALSASRLCVGLAWLAEGLMALSKRRRLASALREWVGGAEASNAAPASAAGGGQRHGLHALMASHNALAAAQDRHIHRLRSELEALQEDFLVSSAEKLEETAELHRKRAEDARYIRSLHETILRAQPGHPPVRAGGA